MNEEIKNDISNIDIKTEMQNDNEKQEELNSSKNVNEENENVNEKQEELNSSKDINVEVDSTEIQTYSIKDFNTLETTEGQINFNQEMYIQLRTTNLYLNFILLAITTCFLYYVISKALKKLFYINI